FNANTYLSLPCGKAGFSQTSEWSSDSLPGELRRQSRNLVRMEPIDRRWRQRSFLSCEPDARYRHYRRVELHSGRVGSQALATGLAERGIDDDVGCAIRGECRWPRGNHSNEQRSHAMG